jgi:hypothetical protein
MLLNGGEACFRKVQEVAMSDRASQVLARLDKAELNHIRDIQPFGTSQGD